MRKLVGCLVLGVWVSVTFAQTPDAFVVRNGIGNAVEKLRQGQDVTVAFFGASIMEMPNSWCEYVVGQLRTDYPKAQIKMVKSAIGGTGSSLGVFRFRRDVLAHRPDLVFVSMVNDCWIGEDEIRRNFEGFLRQLWRESPRTDVVFCHAASKDAVQKHYRQPNDLHHPVKCQEEIADHYGIPSVRFGFTLAERLKRGDLVMTIGEVPFPAPKGTPDRDKMIVAQMAKQGKVIYSKDGVHPLPPGHEILGKAVVRAIRAMDGLSPVDHAKALAIDPIAPDHYERAKMLPVAEWMMTGDWRQVAASDWIQKCYGKWAGQWWRAERPGSSLCFRFRGRLVRLYDIMGPDSCQVRVFVDGKERLPPIPLFDEYSSYPRLHTFTCFQSAADEEHEIKLVIDAKQPDRRCVLKRSPKEDLSAKKFDGTVFYASQVMLVGDLLDQ